MAARIRCGPCPVAPGLILCAGVFVAEGAPASETVSATGIDEAPDLARLKCEAELQERLAIRALRSRGAAAAVDAPRAAAILGHETLARSGVSFGVAAGVDCAAARRAAVDELFERWRGRLWWVGHAAAKRVDVTAAEAAEALAARWRAVEPSRSGFLTLHSGRERAVVAAWSTAADGSRLAVGLACRDDEEAAVAAALRERLSVEFGAALIERRAANQPLSAAEARIARAGQRRFDTYRDPRFAPRDPVEESAPPDLEISEAAPEIADLDASDPRFVVSLAADRRLYDATFGPRPAASVFGADAFAFLT